MGGLVCFLICVLLAGGYCCTDACFRPYCAPCLFVCVCLTFVLPFMRLSVSCLGLLFRFLLD